MEETEVINLLGRCSPFHTRSTQIWDVVLQDRTAACYQGLIFIAVKILLDRNIVDWKRSGAYEAVASRKVLCEDEVHSHLAFLGILLDLHYQNSCTLPEEATTSLPK